MSHRSLLLALLVLGSTLSMAMGRTPSDPATWGDVTNVQQQVTTNKTAQDAMNTQTNDRLENVEKMKLFLENDVRLYDGKYVQFALFNLFDMQQAKEFGCGGRLTLKIGKSYEEKQIEKLRAQMQALTTMGGLE